MILWTRAGSGTRKHPTLANGEIEDLHRPRIVEKNFGDHRADVRFKPIKRERYWAGSFQSLQPFGETLSGGDFKSLADACRSFEHPMPPERDGSLRALLGEVRTASSLYVRLLSLHQEISPRRPPTPAISAGAYAGAVLERAGIDPPLKRWPDFPQEILSATASAYFAGDLFVQARASGLPVMALDLRGAYPTAAVLVGASEVLMAESIEIVEQDPDEVAATIRHLAELLRKARDGRGPELSSDDLRFAAWTTVLVEPGGAMLPARSPRGERRTVRRRPLRSRSGPLWYQAMDVLVHGAEGGETPRMERAFTLRPQGRVKTKSIRLPSGRVVDPSSEDLVLALVEERERVAHEPDRSPEERKTLRGFLKGMANALVSGLSMQVNDDEPTKKLRPQMVFHPRTGEPENLRLRRIESPGGWYFPPLAVAVHSTTRLLLQFAISTVRSMGGVVAYWDTDSVFVVSTPTGDMIPFPGGPHRTIDGRSAIRALSHAEVREARLRVEAAFPAAQVPGTYVDASGPDGLWLRVPEPGILRVEPEHRIGPSGYRAEVRLASRAPKRYAISVMERPGGHVKISADGGPAVVGPTADEIRSLSTVGVLRPSKHGLPYHAPAGASGWIAEGYEHLIRLEEGLPTERPWWWDEPAIMVVPVSLPHHAEVHPEARPYSKVAVKHVPLLGPIVSPWHPGFDPQQAAWFDLTGKEIRATFPGGYSLGETLGQALGRIWRSADSTALGPEGMPATGETEAVLSPAPLVVTGIHFVGKESHHRGTGRGALSKPEHLHYGSEEPWEDVIKALSLVVHDASSRTSLVGEVGVSRRWLDEISSGREQPSPALAERLRGAVANRASEWLRRMHPSVPVPQTDLGVIARYLESDPQPARRCQEPECGRLLEGRRRLWCSDAHRKKFERDAQQRLDP